MRQLASDAAAGVAVDTGHPRPASPTPRGGGQRTQRSWLAALTRERRHCTPAHRKERVVTPANALTLTRLLASTSLLVTAIALGSIHLLIAVLAGGWLLDTADGYVARRTKSETVFGAQLDAAVDRFTILVALVGATTLHGGGLDVIALAAIVWLQYGVIDQILFAQFLRFDLWTADEFHHVDRTVWLVSWSQLAKIGSGVPTAGVVVGGFLAYCGAGLAIVLIAVRLTCYVRIAKVASRGSAPSVTANGGMH